MYRIVLLFWLFCCALTLSAQTVHPDYMDGRVYLKLNDRTPHKLGDVDQIRATGEPRLIAALLDRYEVQSIQLAFPLLTQNRTFQTTYEIRFGAAAAVEGFLVDLRAWSEVEYVERVPLYRTVLTPNDPNQSNQWYLNTINAAQAWDLHIGGNSVVAIVDDAVKITHQDLAGNTWVNPGETPNNGIDDDGNGFIDDVNGWDAADNDNNPNPPASATNFSFTHGTHVAGIVSATTDNGVGMASIGFDTKIMAIKATYDTASNTAVIHAGLLGVQYAIAAGADVISMSWGGPGFSNTANNIMNQAFTLGITLVAAAGNDNVSSQFYPAGYTNVIAVASTAQSDAKSSFSNYGSWITVSAPGSGIYSTLAGSNASYGNQSGTSMACPMVSGLIGLMKSYAPGASPTDLRNCIVSSADNIDAQNPSFVGLLGGGRINAFAALQCINPNVAPNADFAADKLAGCTGLAVQFSDLSSGNPTSWSWSFSGGAPASSAQQNPTVTYNSPGTYNVSLTATNGFGSGSETKNGYITVLSNGLALPFVEDFESGDFAANSWTLDNPDADYTWEIATIGGTSPGDKAAKMDFYFYNSVGQRDGLITPPLNFTGLSSAQLTFDHAYRRFNTNASDSLIILVSTDCGATFPTRIFAGAEDGTGTFATASTNTSPFTPAVSDDWCTGPVGANCFTVDLTAFVGNGNVVLRFEAYTNYQNNLFIDNINISGVSVNQAPVADFNANTTFGCAPLAVNFNDLSTPAATSWNWNFGDGSPQSSAQNPSHSYTSPGTYTVTLTATNAFGADSETKTSFITVNACTPGICDTLSNFNNGTATVYTSNNGGFASGHNGYEDASKAEFFTNSNTYLTAIAYNFAVASNASAGATLTCTVWDADGPGSEPGTVLGTTTILISDIANDISNGNATFVEFGGPVNLSGDFYAGIELNYGAGGSIVDTVALVTNTDGDTSPATAWEEWSGGGGWFAYDDASSWGLGVSHAIFPFTTSTLPVANFSADQTQLCLGEQVQFTNASTDASAFDWILPGANPYNPTGGNPLVTYDTAGTHDVILIAYGECFAFDVAVVSNQITVGAPPQLFQGTIVNDACGQGIGQASVNASGGGGGYTYLWNTNPPQNGPTASGLSFGTYTATVIDANGCSADLTLSVGDQPGPVASVDAWANASCGLSNGNAQASVSSGTAPFQYSWTTSPIQTSGIASGLGAGNYKVFITDANNCLDSASVLIASTPAVALSLDAQDASCAEDGSVTAQISAGTAPYDYSWDTNPPQSGSSITGLGAGTYAVFVIDASSCEANASVTIGQTGSAPTADFSFTNAPGQQQVDFTNTSTGGGLTYLWDFGDGNTSTDANPSYDFPFSGGNFTVTLIVTNSCGSDTSTRSFFLTDLDLRADQALQVFPVPTEDRLWIEGTFPGVALARLSVFNALGQQVRGVSVPLTAGRLATQLSLADMAEGIYTLRVEIDGQIVDRRVMKR